MSKSTFAIIGAGLIGGKRAQALKKLGHAIVSVYDPDSARAQKLAGEFDAEVAASLEAVCKNAKIDAVVIAATHNVLTEISIAALKAGKHVLVEKPAGRNPAELERLLAAAKDSKKILRVGFNHRFHPAFLKAKEILASGELGPFLYIRAKYGHGGRLGYEKEWRADPALSGGGELIDQGSHLIDLSLWLGGNMDLAFGHAQTFFWKMPVEDNGFLLLRSKDGERAAHLHASCTEWKNLFQFEIFCRMGKIDITGLGRSYGTEEIKIYRMQPEMGPPPVEQASFPGEDTSWEEEMKDFAASLEGAKNALGATATDAHNSIKIIYDTYRQSGLEWS